MTEKVSALNRSGPKPLYLQLEDILRAQIMEGVLKHHEAIPSENELSRIYDLSRMTVRGVITRLVSEGLLYRVPGKGTFVSDKPSFPEGHSRAARGYGLRDRNHGAGQAHRESRYHDRP